MEELKNLAAVLKDLPHTAVWAIVAFLVYKLSVLASIYATIRFVVARIADAYIAKVNKPLTTIVKLGNGVVLGDHAQSMLELQIMRLVRKGHTNYVHDTDVKWLSEVLDEALAKRK